MKFFKITVEWVFDHFRETREIYLPHILPLALKQVQIVVKGAELVEEVLVVRWERQYMLKLVLFAHRLGLGLFYHVFVRYWTHLTIEIGMVSCWLGVRWFRVGLRVFFNELGFSREMKRFFFGEDSWCVLSCRWQISALLHLLSNLRQLRWFWITVVDNHWARSRHLLCVDFRRWIFAFAL